MRGRHATHAPLGIGEEPGHHVGRGVLVESHQPPLLRVSNTSSKSARQASVSQAAMAS
ncbi:hypothetical protein HDC93_007195 [Streptomyces sp. AK010]|nr:hypothetical protein [Streptomyces sp. AK010]